MFMPPPPPPHESLKDSYEGQRYEQLCSRQIGHLCRGNRHLFRGVVAGFLCALPLLPVHSRDLMNLPSSHTASHKDAMVRQLGGQRGSDDEKQRDEHVTGMDPEQVEETEKAHDAAGPIT